MSSQRKLVVALNLLMVFFWISPYSLAGEIPDLLLVFFTTVFSLKIVLRIRRERLPIRKAILYYLATVPSMLALCIAILLIGVFPLLLYVSPGRGNLVGVVNSPDNLKAVYVYQKSKSEGFSPDEEATVEIAMFWLRYRYIPLIEKEIITNEIVLESFHIRDYENKKDYERAMGESSISGVQWIDRDRIIIDHTGEVISP